MRGLHVARTLAPMTSYNGLPGVHRPVPRISQDAGYAVLIRMTPDGVFDPAQRIEWAVLTGPRAGAHRVGQVDTTALAQTLQDAAVEHAGYVLGVPMDNGSVVPLSGDGDVPQDIAVAAGQAITALWS